MAKMIPSAISPKVKSAAEKKIFEWFKNDPLTKDWVVFHSLGIENHQTVVFGEIDFLVLASDLGIFALEVKGGRVKREDGVWVYTDKYGVEHKKVRGPFEQAGEGMYSVMDELKKRGGTRSVLNGYGVMFPDIEYVNSDIDCAQEQIFDKRDAQYVGRFIKRLSDYSSRKLRDKKVLVVYPSHEDVNDIVNVLRKDFDKAVPISTKIEYAEDKILTLTEEQLRCIDGLASNPRCLINGAAGTGKTVLAIKNAKDSIANGKQTAVFCYNLLLAKELQRHFAQEGIQPAYVGSFTDFLEKLVRKHTDFDFSTITDLSKFYKEDLPMLALDALEKAPVQFDKIIIDEAQDLMVPDYLELYDTVLKGGLKKGEWYFFGDYDLQTIYNRGVDHSKVIDMLEDRANFAMFDLTVNCRNTPAIQTEMNRIAGVTMDTLKKDDALPPVRYIQFDSPEEEKELVEQELKKLIANGINRREITLLSPFKFEKSVASQIKKYKIASCREDTEEITYSTIQGFKGMENTVIFLTDIQTYNKPDLMYVAMSRPRSMLVIFETKAAEKYRKQNC